MTGDVVAWHRSPSDRQGASVVVPPGGGGLSPRRDHERTARCTSYRRRRCRTCSPARSTPTCSTSRCWSRAARRRVQRRAAAAAPGSRRPGRSAGPRHPRRSRQGAGPRRGRHGRRRRGEGRDPHGLGGPARRAGRASQRHRRAPRGRRQGLAERQGRGHARHSVPQIGAPEAWAAGYDGTGATVAVLDTGYDAEHPDLAGRVGRGAGLHRTSRARPTTARPRHPRRRDRRRRRRRPTPATGTGVAPGAELLIGKVLDDDGDRLLRRIIAGMEWAAAQGADVVNMSLGAGPPTDGTDPLSPGGQPT